MTRVAIVQVGGAPAHGAENRHRATAAARSALADGADIVVLPELVVPGYSWDRETLWEQAEPVDGETVGGWVDLAAESGGCIAGGFAERAGSRLFNTAVLAGPQGVLLHYRKLHLFAGEKDVFAPGDRGLPVAVTPHGTIGLCICYDLRFVETLRALALRGAQLVCVPTAWVPGFDAERWDAEGYCPQARGALLQANLDGVFVACASQAGQPGEHRFLGSSVVADPRGRCRAGPLSGTQEDRAIVDLDLAQVDAAADRGGGIRPAVDRRTDVYGLELEGERL